MYFTRMKIVFMGSADFGIPVLDTLCRSKHQVVGIVSTPDRQRGRGLKTASSPVAHYSHIHAIAPILKPEDLKAQDFVESLRDLKADIFVVVAFRILPSRVFSLPPLGSYNIHASLLPRYRGPAPIQRAIAAGEKKTGITLFRIDEGIDTGNVLLWKETQIGDDETAPQLYKRLSALGADSIISAMDLIERGEAVFAKQDPSIAGNAPKLTKQEGNVDWSRSAASLFNMIRAFKPFPGSYSFLSGRRIAVEWAVPIDGSSNARPGSILRAGNEGIDVQCGQGGLRITEIKPEGKNIMNAAAFAAGRNIVAGAMFTEKKES